MPVSAITYQPNTAQLLAAYRPIRFIVIASTDAGTVPPYVACDIYIKDQFYKTVLRTAPEEINGANSSWAFDISDALQEYLQPDIAAIDNNDVLQAPHMSAKVYCKFRASYVDSEGFTVEEGTRPIQGTKFTAPTSGTGVASNTFFVINATLQHEDNQNLAQHLTAFKQGGWHSDAFPLSHRTKDFFCPDDSDHYPVIYRGECISADLVLNYRLKGESVFQTAIAIDNNVCASVDYELFVTGNKVDVETEAVPTGYYFVQYKKQADLTWKDAGVFTTQNFSFNVNGSDLAGDYDIRVVHFCTPCLSAEAVLDEFTLSGEVINTEWRGINPFCVQSSMDSPLYLEYEIRNLNEEEIYFPDESEWETITKTVTGELYVKFFSDPERITPVMVSDTLLLYIKKSESRTISAGGSIIHATIESLEEFSVTASGNEALVDSITASVLITEENGNSNQSLFAFAPYPSEEYSGGNTGYLGYANLREYNIDTNEPTTTPVKENLDTDPDYIAPHESNLCPVGPDKVMVYYGYGLEVSKVEFNVNGSFVYATPVAETSSIDEFLLNIPRNTPVNITVKAKSIITNTTGVNKVKVLYATGPLTNATATFNIPNNIETALPQTFQNIISVTITNF